MPERTKFKWTVTLQASTGDEVVETFEAHWSPDFEGIKEIVGSACAAMLWWANDKKLGFAPIKVERA